MEKESIKTNMRRGMEKGRQKTRNNHLGYPQNPLRKRQ